MTCAIYLTPKSWKPIATCKKWCRKNLNFLILIQANIVTHMTYAIYLTPKSLEPITTRKKWCKKTLNFQISIHANIVTHMTYAIYLTPKSLEPIATCEKWCKKNLNFLISIQADIVTYLFKVLWLGLFAFTFAQAKEVKVACSFVKPNRLVPLFLSYPFWSQLCLSPTFLLIMSTCCMVGVGVPLCIHVVLFCRWYVPYHVHDFHFPNLGQSSSLYCLAYSLPFLNMFLLLFFLIMFLFFPS
jgi:hypothetical protein